MIIDSNNNANPSVAQSFLRAFVWIIVWFVQTEFTSAFTVPRDLRLSITLCEKAKSGSKDSSHTTACPVDGNRFATFNVDYPMQKKWRDGKPLVVVFRQYKPEFIKSSDCSYRIALEECYLQNAFRAKLSNAAEYRSYLIRKGCIVSDSVSYLPNKTSTTTCIDSDVDLALRINLTEYLAGPAIVHPWSVGFFLECKAILCSPEQTATALPRCSSYTYNKTAQTCNASQFNEGHKFQQVQSGRFYVISSKRRKTPSPSPIPTQTASTPKVNGTTKSDPSQKASTPAQSTSTPPSKVNGTTKSDPSQKESTSAQSTSTPPSSPRSPLSTRQQSVLPTGPEYRAGQRANKDSRKPGSLAIGLTSGASSLLIAGTAVAIYILLRRHRIILSSYSGRKTTTDAEEATTKPATAESLNSLELLKI